jgi:GNAT superfamily N-acetyltransferase
MLPWCAIGVISTIRPQSNEEMSFFSCKDKQSIFELNFLHSRTEGELNVKELQFRRLELDDVPNVRELIKDFWEGHDYVGSEVQNWIEKDDCFPFGAFRASSLVGLGNVHWFTPELGWIQGIRVLPSLQHQGIGKELFGFAREYCVRNGANVVQFTTSIQNKASMIIAHDLGFVRKASMNVLWLEREKIIPIANCSDLTRLRPEKALEFLRKIPGGPKEEVCVGWSFNPLDLQHLKQIGGVWYGFEGENALVLEFVEGDETVDEDPSNEAWLIAYGSEDGVRRLLGSLVGKYVAKKISGVEIFCPEALIPVAAAFGFRNQDKVAEKVILLEYRVNALE